MADRYVSAHFDKVLLTQGKLLLKVCLSDLISTNFDNFGIKMISMFLPKQLVR